MAVIFKNKHGESLLGDSLKEITKKPFLKRYEGKVDLIITSPPFDLVTPKSYGNLSGKEYIDWLSEFAVPLANLLSETGSIVIELGNSYNKGEPTFSTIPIEALLEFKKRANLYLCQEFICHNPARLPSPAHWVNAKRVRVKDSYTRVWWLSKTPFPKANNSNILKTYSPSMKQLIKGKKNNNTGKRPSGHVITENISKDNLGSISPNFLEFHSMDQPYLFETAENSLSISNTRVLSKYNSFCRENEIEVHPARIQPEMIEFFIRFLTEENDTVFDPFAGSNTTGYVSQGLNRKWVSCELNLDYIKGSLINFYNEDKSKLIIKKLAERSFSKVG